MNTQDHISEITPPQPHGSGRGQPYQFSPDELQVLKECNRESFFQRCLPIGTFFGVATFYGVQAGHLKPSPRWGAAPKVVVASILGYFIGKISYQAKCAEKLMQLPDSRLGAVLRQKRRGAGLQESLEPGYGAGMSLSPFSSISPADTYSDIGPNTGDLDTTRPDNTGLDDYNRPTVDSNPVFEDDALPPQQEKTTSYDELRRQNREDYQKQRNSFYKGFPNAVDGPQVRRPPETSTPSQGDSTPKQHSTPRRTNIYGDPIE